MTTLHAPRAAAPATVFESALRHTAHALDAFVDGRLEARASRRSVAQAKAQTAAADRRATALATGGLGMLPR